MLRQGAMKRRKTKRGDSASTNSQSSDHDTNRHPSNAVGISGYRRPRHGDGNRKVKRRKKNKVNRANRLGLKGEIAENARNEILDKIDNIDSSDLAAESTLQSNLWFMQSCLSADEKSAFETILHRNDDADSDS